MYLGPVTSGNGDSFVLVYPKGRTSYTRVLGNSAIVAGFAVAVDSHGNIFARGRGTGTIVDYPNGQEAGNTILGIVGVSSAAGLEFDRRDDLIVVDENIGVLVYAPPYSGGPSQT